MARHGRMQFSDISDETSTTFGRQPGCYVSPVRGFVMCLLTVAVVVIVGVAVYFAHPCLRKNCADNIPTPVATMDPQRQWEICVNLSAARNECLPGHNCPTTTLRPTTSPVVANIRLPTNILPLHYDVTIRPHIYGGPPSSFTFDGRVAIRMRCVNETNVITLHADTRTLNISHVILSDATDQNRTIPILLFGDVDLERDFYRIHTREFLKKGTVYIMEVKFTGPLRADLEGVYYSQYEDGNEKRYLMASQVHPTKARKAFPCFDEPLLRTTFNVTLFRKTSRNFVTFSNTIVRESINMTDDWTADHYEQTPPMSTYLLMFVVSDFKCVDTKTSRNITVSVCARPNAMDQLTFASSVAAQMLDYYEDFYRVPYPMPRLGHVAVPDFPYGAMENWGFVMYRESNILYDAASSSARNKQDVAKIIAHETAHQWFGNLVTPGWWDDIWLNEGFASYKEYQCTNDSFPDWQMESQFVIGAVQNVFRSDGLATSHPIYQSVLNPVQISEIFDSIAYDKGASVIRMMKYFLNGETFRQGISNYLREMAYKVVTHNDLWRFLSEQANRDNRNVDVKAVMDTWILQMGYPVVKVSFSPQNRQEVTVSQKHFLLDPSKPVTTPSPFHYIWKVPLTLVTDKDQSWDNPKEAWLETSTGTVKNLPAASSWVLANIYQRYYYRVNYDMSNWDALINQLNVAHERIDNKNRAQIIDDAFNLGRAGDIEQLVGMRATEYLDKESHYIPWQAARRNLDYIHRMLALTGSYGYLQKYTRSKIQPQYIFVGWTENVNTDSHIVQLSRSFILSTACNWGLQDCLDNATRLFKTWIDQVNGTSPISLNLRSVTYCSAIKNGGQDVWDFAFQKYKETNSGSEKSTLLGALACSTEHWILQRYLDMTLPETYIRRQDMGTVVASVARNPTGRFLAWNFFRENWQTIKERFGASSFLLARMVTAITESFSTKIQMDELKDFMTRNPNQASASTSFRQALETTRVNVDWRQRNEANIVNWLKNKLKS